MNPYNLLLTFAIMASLFIKAHAQSDLEVLIQTPKATFQKTPISISPDNYTMELNRFKNYTNAKTGGELGLSKFSSKIVNIGLTAGGFLEIRDFSPDKILNFGLWRGQLEVVSHWQFEFLQKALKDHQNLVFSIGWGHESQHIEENNYYREVFEESLSPSALASNINNPLSGINNPGPFILSTKGRGFDYYTLSLNYTSSSNQNYNFDFKGRYRQFYEGYYQHNSNPLLKHGFSLESGMTGTLSNEFKTYFKGFFEWIQHNLNYLNLRYFREKFRNNLNDRALTYYKGELGIFWNKKKPPVLNLYCYYTYSNGRQMDFPRIYEGMAWGFRVAF